MLRAMLIGALVSAAIALAARLVVRWKFGGKSKVKRLKPHGAVEYATFALVMLTAVLVTTAQRAEGATGLVWLAALALGVSATVASVAVFATQVFWTAEGIGTWDPFRKQRFVRFDDVAEVRAVPRVATFVSDGRTRIGFAAWRTGADELARFIALRCAGARRP
jgi:magnesium-transporting ATPase (P-type)